MALKKEFNMLEKDNRQFCDYPNAYHKPINISININQAKVTVQMGVYADKKARSFVDSEDVDFIHQYKEIFTFKEFGLTKKKLIDSAYKCLKKLDKFKDAEDV